jgi:fatty acid desaturase
MAVFVDWTIIAIAIAACLVLQRWYGWVLAVFIIGNRQHALGVLMHEGVHYRITPARKYNDLLADLLTGYPVFMPTANYRAFHLAHHQFLDTPRDPEGAYYRVFPNEARFPLHPAHFGFIVLRDLSGVWPPLIKLLLSVIWTLPGQSRRHLIPIALMHGSVQGVLIPLDLWHVYLLLWLLPLATVFMATFRIRSMTEHHGIAEAGNQRYVRQTQDIWRTTRTIRGPIGCFLFGPHGINYHLEHHLYPSVPFFNLKQLSQHLQTTRPADLRPRIRTNYWVAIGECISFDSRKMGRNLRS